MPLGKDDNPKSNKAAVDDVLDAGAGVPDAYTEAAEALPENDDVQKATKESFLADTGQAEAKAKVKAVDASPNAAETPSGAALKETAGIADNKERGEEYARIKAGHRWGYVTPDLAKKDK